MTGVLMTLLLTGACCALCGVFLVLRNQSMMADAISHTVLLGIVLAFLLVRDVASPWLMIGATVAGLLTVYLVERLSLHRVLRSDDAIGFVFPVFFSAAVLLLSRFARNTHLCMDTVMMGEVIFSALDTVTVLGMSIPRIALEMGILLLVNLLFITLFYKEVKVSAFDGEFSVIIGLPVTLLFYCLMGLTSLTAVKAFDAVGTVLVLSFFIAPAASACMITRDLRMTLLLSVVIASVNVLAGFFLGMRWNVSLSGMCAVTGMVTFLLILFLHRGGVLGSMLQRRQNRALLHMEMFIVHVGNHMKEQRFTQEAGVSSIGHHLKWSARQIHQVSRRLLQKNLICRERGHYSLTAEGLRQYDQIRRTYCLK